MNKKNKNTDVATFAGGCFWCQDAVFDLLKGVKSVKSGYSGGDVENPTYEQVSAGNTGHREAVQIEFDPKAVSFEELLDIFWASHHPTQKGGQGPDTGPQYEAAIFYHNEEQKKIAEKSKKDLQESFDDPIVTEVLPYKNFYEAELYHQDYYEKNPDASYSQAVINPKVEKVKELFKEKLK